MPLRAPGAAFPRTAPPQRRRRRAGEAGPVAGAVSAASVNCETRSRPPATSCTLRFILPAASPKMRSLSSLSDQPAACAGVSAGSAQTSTSSPAPMAPTTAPATSTAPGHPLHERDQAGPSRRRSAPPRPAAAAGWWRAGRAPRSSRPAPPTCARPPRGPASRRRACACAGRRSAAGRRAASPRGRSGWPGGGSRPAPRRSRPASRARRPRPSARRPSATPATRPRAGCSGHGDGDHRVEPQPAGVHHRQQAGTTPAEVQTSVNRWRASASSAIERCSRALRSIDQASAAVHRRAHHPQQAPAHRFQRLRAQQRCTAATTMASAATKISTPSKPLEKYSALWWP